MLKNLVPGLVLLLWVTATAAADVNTIIKNSQHKAGYFDLYYDQSTDKLYLEIKQFEQEFLYQTALVQGLGSNDIGLDRGRLSDTKVVHWVRQGNKVFLKQNNLKYRADTQDPLEAQTIDQAFADSIIWGGELVDTQSKRHLVDISSLVLDDRQQVLQALSRTKQGSYKLDSKRSAIASDHTKAFPKNTEVSAWLTFTSQKAGKFVDQVAADGTSFTLLTRHSFIELPDANYKPRQFHPYSGFWSVGYQNYSAPIDQDMRVQFIPRHRLLKKHPEKAKSEPVKPIIYYLDSGTPEPVRTSLLDGARWWNEAFEAAGYIDAFQVKMLPADADPLDVRYNVIQWVHRATRGWSYGASVVDPRTGEIVKGHVTLGSLRVRQDLLIARGLKAAFTDDSPNDIQQQQMALDRIRQLSAHEVGHTLGIAHNFAASVNNRASVMDYPHPYVTLENGQVNFAHAYDKGIGEWDIQVVKYGYSDFQQESAGLTAVLQQSRDMGLRYLSDPDSRSVASANPYASLWDNGDDAVAELNRLSGLRRHALDNYSLANIQQGQPLSDLQETLVPIYLLHRFQVQAAAKVIGGVDYGYWLRSDGKKLSHLDPKWQKQALQSVVDTLAPEYLALPEHLQQLILPKIYGDNRNRESFPSNNGLIIDPLAIAEVAARHSLTWLLNPQRLNRVLHQQTTLSDSLTIKQVFDSVLAASFDAEAKPATLAAIHQRINFVTADQLLGLLHDKTLAPEIKSQLKQRLQHWIFRNSSRRGAPNYQGHYAYLASKLKLGLTDSQIKLIEEPAKLPPGSPI